MSQLWQAGAATEAPHVAVARFTAGKDYALDSTVFVPYDCRASRAHASMLAGMGVLSRDLCAQGCALLEQIEADHAAGTFAVRPEQEDCHTAIEERLTAELPAFGKAVHTFRSRNDQALVMMRLWLLETLRGVRAKAQHLAGELNAASARFAEVPMPGYTHTQKGMPTTVGAFLNAYACAVADGVAPVTAAISVIDQNPLGSAAGYGVQTVALRRDITTTELGFDRVQENPLYCGLSRGAFEHLALASCDTLVLFMTRFAADMVNFTSDSYGFFRLPASFVTGSSIMPQKKNYDVFELLRAGGRAFVGRVAAVRGVASGVGSGYHRDLQACKGEVVGGLASVVEILEVTSLCVSELQCDEEKLRAAMTPELYLTDEIYRRVAGGAQFRDAYREVKREYFGAVDEKKKN